MILPVDIKHYHVFLASPGDMANERKSVRRFFERYNRTTARRWGVSFDVIDWENYADAGIGRPQELITAQTLERFRDSLALVIGLMGQRFGTPSTEAESGTEEEFDWALDTHLQTGFPEIKWFFRRIDEFRPVSTKPDEMRAEVDQWEKVLNFKERLSTAGLSSSSRNSRPITSTMCSARISPFACMHRSACGCERHRQ